VRYSSQLIIRSSTRRKTDRFYHLYISEDLFGSYLLIKEYGEMGRSGIIHKTDYRSVEDAFQALVICERRMLKRGYKAA